MTSALADPPDTSVVTIRRAGGTIVVRPAPHREPPFDDELGQETVVAGPHDRPLPFERPRRRRAALPPAPPRTGVLPDPAEWGRRLLVGVIETAAGRRPLNQLSALLSAGVAYGLRTDFEDAARRGRPHWTHRAVIRSVHASQPADDVAEISATLRHGDRVRALAMRLEVRHNRWCCTNLVIG